MAQYEVTVKLTVNTPEGMTPHIVMLYTISELARLRDSVCGQGDVDIVDERGIHTIQLRDTPSHGP
jgi:hypothetical protein